MRTIPGNLLCYATSAALAIAMIGCGGHEPRGEVVGHVTFDGQPIVAGMVSFEPVETAAPPRNVPIQNGEYRVSGNLALPPGSYRVRVTAADQAKMNAKAADNPNALPEFVPLLPASWNVNSNLTVKIQEGRNTTDLSGKKGETPRVEVKAD